MRWFFECCYLAMFTPYFQLKLYFVAGRCGHGSACEQLCYELHDGMYECDCRQGYELNKDGYSCFGKITYTMFYK